MHFDALFLCLARFHNERRVEEFIPLPC